MPNFIPRRKVIEQDIQAAIHPGGQHVGMPRVQIEAHTVQRMFAIIDKLEAESATLKQILGEIAILNESGPKDGYIREQLKRAAAL